MRLWHGNGVSIRNRQKVSVGGEVDVLADERCLAVPENHLHTAGVEAASSQTGVVVAFIWIVSPLGNSAASGVGGIRGTVRIRAVGAHLGQRAATVSSGSEDDPRSP